MTRAALYLRISQDRDGTLLGVDRQREDCTAACERHGWALTEVFVDDDVSAYSRRKVRRGYRAMLEALEAGRVDAVVAWHPDRLHRSPTELEEFIDLIETTGAQVATVQAGDLALASATGRMTARIVGAVARHESEHKAERLRRQREQAATAGTYHGGRRPFAYAKDGVSVVDDEAALVREGAVRVLAGESLRKIADDWNGRGIASSSGKAWQITTLRSMLAGPRLAGLRVHRGEIVGDAEWEPIIDRETFEKLRLILGDPRRRQSGRTPTHLLSGLVRCGRCGQVLHASRRSDGARRYACNVKPGHDNCGRVAISADPLERLITESILYRISAPAVAKAMRRKPNKNRTDNGSIVAECERKLDELAEMFAADELGRREWLSARAVVEQRLEKARHALAREQGTEALAPLRSVDPAAAWQALDLDRQRAVVAALINRISVGSANGRSAFAADRVNIEWRA